ncbi:hypothetical protein MXB_995 [Myxobolus squamalis]|nr:hypothetical protein MXB_995 [Myxobolus squamalis]
MPVHVWVVTLISLSFRLAWKLSPLKALFISSN